MSDTMLFGVLRMSFEMAMKDRSTQFQYWQRGQEAADEIERLREALQKIADIEHEDIPAPRTPNEGTVWTVLAMVVGLAEKALKEGE